MVGKEKKKRILLIDNDETQSLRKVQELLQKSDFNIIISDDVNSVLRLMTESSVDAVIAEFGSLNPNVDKCIKEIRKIKGETIPIVLLTTKSKKKKNNDELIRVAEYTGMAPTSANDLRGMLKSLSKELSSFKLIDPDDFTSIEMDGQVLKIDDESFVTDFKIIEFSKNEFWLETSENLLKKGDEYRFQIRLMEKDFAVDLNFTGKVIEVIEQKDEAKLTILVHCPNSDELRSLESIKDKLEERQSSIMNFLNKTKGLE